MRKQTIILFHFRLPEFGLPHLIGLSVDRIFSGRTHSWTRVWTNNWIEIVIKIVESLIWPIGAWPQDYGG
jgi:hypothetical protein